MTREEIEKNFTIKEGIIHSPGKFEGEPLWAPYFWEIVLEEAGHEGNEAVTSVDVSIDDRDREIFPELCWAKEISLWCDDNGFVYTKLKGDL